MALADNYKYPFTYAVDNKSSAKTLAQLTAKCTQENITTEDKATKIEFFNPFDSNYIDSSVQEVLPLPGEGEQKYSFIKRTDSIFDKLWGSKPAIYATAYKDSSSNVVKLEDAAAWGCCPIPKRVGLGNTGSPYINTYTSELVNGLELRWITSSTDPNQEVPYIQASSPTSTVKTVVTTASCVVIDVVAGGGNGGYGYRRAWAIGGAGGVGGGGGGSGAAASLLIDMEKVNNAGCFIQFHYTPNTDTTESNTVGNLVVKSISKTNSSTSTTLITLKNGARGNDGAEANNSGTGGSGGAVTLGANATGTKVLWSSSGATGGQGGRYNTKTILNEGGTHGNDSPSKITFLKPDSVGYYLGGKRAPISSTIFGGGGGGGSIFASGDNGRTAGTTATNAGFGAGGGGGWVCNDDDNKALHTGSGGRRGYGGNPYVKMYYESTRTTTYVTPAPEKATGSVGYGDRDPITPGGGGCIFAGTQLSLDQTATIDIANFVPGTQVDFCNPDTLEHFSQQTIARLYSQHATTKITIQLEDGKKIALTPDHPILTLEGLKLYIKNQYFSQYIVGDFVATIDGYKQIVAIKEENIDPTIVYNLVTENSLLVANGIIIAGEIGLNIETTAITDSDFEKALPDDFGGGSIIP